MDAYILDDNHQPVRAELVEAARWRQNFPDKWQVANTELPGCRVSTVFLAHDHNFFGGGPPVLFETMVFEGPLDMEQWRYCTWEEAEEGHKAVVQLVSATIQGFIDAQPNSTKRRMRTRSCIEKPPPDTGMLRRKPRLKRAASSSTHAPKKGQDMTSMQADIKLPEGYTVLDKSDVNERIQAGDLLWSEEDYEWHKAERVEIGDYVYGFYAVARVTPVNNKPAPQPTVKRIRRTRRPQ